LPDNDDDDDDDAGYCCCNTWPTSGPVTTWMGDCLLTGKPSRNVTNHLGYQRIRGHFYNEMRYINLRFNLLYLLTTQPFIPPG